MYDPTVTGRHFGARAETYRAEAGGAAHASTRDIYLRLAATFDGLRDWAENLARQLRPAEAPAQPAAEERPAPAAGAKPRKPARRRAISDSPLPMPPQMPV